MEIIQETYSPISLIDCLVQLYEALIRNRINLELESKQLISENQYGFRKEMSTVYAIMKIERIMDVNRHNADAKVIVLMTLDIKNAFNTANWAGVVVAMKHKGISDYLCNIVDN